MRSINAKSGSGSGAGQVYLAPDWRARSMSGKRPPKKARQCCTVERLLLGLTLEKDSDAGGILQKGGVTRQNLNTRSKPAQGPARDVARPITPMIR